MAQRPGTEERSSRRCRAGPLTLFLQLLDLLVLQVELIGEARGRIQSSVGFVEVHLSDSRRLMSTALRGQRRVL